MTTQERQAIGEAVSNRFPARAQCFDCQTPLTPKTTKFVAMGTTPVCVTCKETRRAAAARAL